MRGLKWGDGGWRSRGVDSRVWYEGMELDWSGGLKVFGGPFGQKNGSGKSILYTFGRIFGSRAPTRRLSKDPQPRQLVKIHYRNPPSPSIRQETWSVDGINHPFSLENIYRRGKVGRASLRARIREEVGKNG